MGYNGRTAPPMQSMTLGHYQILEKLGEGGMGVVWKARDTRLNRLVAIKVLPPARMTDEARKRRFIQEAQAASALNHPNIVTIYEIASDAGCDYIVMEFVPGKTLDAAIPRGGMRLNQLLPIAVQLAEGLSKAHEAGVVHRDIKPANILVPEDGQVRILDFGLAKLTERVAPTFEGGPTMTEDGLSVEGAVMGTAAYMSPEQAQGRKVDARSDIFSFGAVLYEMATGQRAFQADSAASTIAAVLTQEPKSASELGVELPRELERTINRCLRKDVSKRQQSIADVKLNLEELKHDFETGGTGTGAGPMRKSIRPMLLAGAALFAVLAGGSALLLTRSRTQDAPMRIVPLTTTAGSERVPSFSPDGKQVVFTWNGEKQDNTDLYIKLIGSPSTLRLTSDPALDTSPSWSPDGRQIAFVRSKDGVGNIYLISPLGGLEQKLADVRADDGISWSPDSRFVFATVNFTPDKPAPGAGAIVSIALEGGEPKPVLSPEPGGWFTSPAVSPDRRWLAFGACAGSSGNASCRVDRVRLSADYLPAGARERLTPPMGLINSISWTADSESIIYRGGVAFSSYLYRWRPGNQRAPERMESLGSGILGAGISRQGDRLALSRSNDNEDIWAANPQGQQAAFLSSSLRDTHAQFSDDGRRIAFASFRDGESDAIWVANADGTGLAPLVRGLEGRYQGWPAWSPDGRWIAFEVQDAEGKWNVWMADSTGGTARRVTNGPERQTVPSWSRDGNWLYFTSNRSGRFEIWKIPSHGGTMEQVTRNGGYVARESADGKTLYYTKSGQGCGPLFAQPRGSAQEKQVLDSACQRGFYPASEGIYFLSALSGNGPGRSLDVVFHDFATSRNRRLFSAGARVMYGLSVSPDRQTFLFPDSRAPAPT